jgi:hypothetical protein
MTSGGALSSADPLYGEPVASAVLQESGSHGLRAIGPRRLFQQPHQSVFAGFRGVSLTPIEVPVATQLYRPTVIRSQAPSTSNLPTSRISDKEAIGGGRSGDLLRHGNMAEVGTGRSEDRHAASVSRS